MTAKVSYQNWRTQRPAPEQESVGEHLDEVYDTLTGRVFGGCLRLEGEKKTGALEAVDTRFVLRAAALSLQPVELENWKVRAVRLAKEAVTAQAAMERTRRWWNAFWEKSYVFVQGDAAVVPEYED